MTKAEFIQKVVAAVNANGEVLSRGKVEEFTNTVINCIADALKSGEEVGFQGFGTFKIKDRAAHKGRNPQTGAEIQVPAKKAVAFQVSSKLREEINK